MDALNCEMRARGDRDYGGREEVGGAINRESTAAATLGSGAPLLRIRRVEHIERPEMDT